MPEAIAHQVSVHYEITGSGPPLLFLHGLGSSGRDWEIQTTYFSGTHTVMTIDLRGHGESEKPPGPYSIQAFSDDVVAVLMDAVPTERPEQFKKVLQTFSLINRCCAFRQRFR